MKRTDEQRLRDNESARRWRLKNREKALAAQRRWYQNNKDLIRGDRCAALREYYKANRERMKKDAMLYYRKNKPAILARRKANYTTEIGWLNKLKERGLTLTDYEKMVSSQKGRCAICGCKPERKLSIDHCHQTEKIRGLLCSLCNVGLGCFSDSSTIMQFAIDYLSRSNVLK